MNLAVRNLQTQALIMSSQRTRGITTTVPNYVALPILLLICGAMVYVLNEVIECWDNSLIEWFIIIVASILIAVSVMAGIGIFL